MVLTGSLACLYLFHNLSFNFANALWLYIVPVIFLDAIIHVSFNIIESKWKYNRIILSLIMSLIIFSFFPIESYIFLIIRNSLIYQSIICLILINWILPSWNYIIITYFKKNKKEKPAIVETNQSSTTGTEIQNLVYEPNGNTNGSI
jgi:predicted Na+-dependent transporter